MIKISEVRAACDELKGYVANGAAEALSEILYLSTVEAIITTHNAMPVFLEIVEAALALREQQADNIMAALDLDDDHAFEHGNDPDRRRKTMTLNQALTAALAKVTR